VDVRQGEEKFGPVRVRELGEELAQGLGLEA
jgi:hypothetical protein